MAPIRSAPILCPHISGSLTDPDNVKIVKPLIYIIILAFSLAIVGLSIACLTFIKTREPLELFLTSGILGLSMAIFCTGMFFTLLDAFQQRSVDIEVLQERLTMILSEKNLDYIPINTRNPRTPEGEWSSHTDFLNCIKKFVWETQVYALLLFLDLLLILIVLSCICAEEYITAFFIEAITTGFFMYGTVRFSITGALSLSNDYHSLHVTIADLDSPYRRDLETLPDFIYFISGPVFCSLFLMSALVIISLFIISLFYSSI